MEKYEIGQFFRLKLLSLILKIQLSKAEVVINGQLRFTDRFFLWSLDALLM